MHIPKSDTNKIQIESFKKAVQKSVEYSSDYDIEQWIYVPNHYDEYRYLLGTIGKKPLICVGINPSTAEPNQLDPTLKSVERIAFANGFDSFLMFNVYAQRATSPDHMERELNQQLHQENMKAFEYILSRVEEGNPTVWAAWGTIIEKRDYLFSCLQEMLDIGEQFHTQWVSAGKLSKAGHPHHPLYLKKDTQVEPFSIFDYLNKIKERSPSSRNEKKE